MGNSEPTVQIIAKAIRNLDIGHVISVAHVSNRQMILQHEKSCVTNNFGTRCDFDHMTEHIIYVDIFLLELLKLIS